MAIASFDYGAWSTLYPELAGAVPSDRAALLFRQAGLLYLDNTDGSIVSDVDQRQLLLYLIVAHLADLGGARNGGVPTGLVGRVAEATEGSVSVKTDTGLTAGTAAWWAQTSYGFAYWQATAAYRQGFYAPAQQPNFDYRGGLFSWPR